MLNLISVERISKRLQTGEIIQFLSLPKQGYNEIKSDFQFASHLASVKSTELGDGSGVIVNCESEEDGLLAASYLIKKFEEVNNPSWNIQNDEGDENFDPDYESGDMPYDGSEQEDEAKSLLIVDDHLVGLPIITFNEFVHNTHHSPMEDIGNMQFQFRESNNSRNPYWQNRSYPLIVCGDQSSSFFTNVDLFKCAGRFIIYLSVKPKYFQDDHTNVQVNSFEKLLIFDCDFELCQLKKPPISYCKKVLTDSVKKRGFSLSRKLDKEKLLDDLRTYRSTNFSSNQDIVRLVQKVIKKKKDTSKLLGKVDFEKVLIITQEQEKQESVIGSQTPQLDQLIGLHEVKSQLQRIVTKMDMSKKRKRQGLKSSPMHTVACFLGAPGTAKTTVARIFGDMLCSKGVIENSEFLEVGRGDLIGRYVGHTAPKIEKLFRSARGGTLFIDEAYSLLPKGNEDSYSGEALAEIVRQMENNPDTLVIFAGYTDEMKYFIKNANPGLRSRLTNIIEFNHYSQEEMVQIFRHFVEKEDFILFDEVKIEQEIESFLNKMKTLGESSLGNGRLMRKLFQSVLGYMSERENDLKTIMPNDVQKAVKELQKNEFILSDEMIRKIGF